MRRNRCVRLIEIQVSKYKTLITQPRPTICMCLIQLTLFLQEQEGVEGKDKVTFFPDSSTHQIVIIKYYFT
jgi:hypothetical protein